MLACKITIFFSNNSNWQPFFVLKYNCSTVNCSEIFVRVLNDSLPKFQYLSPHRTTLSA